MKTIDQIKEMREIINHFALGYFNLDVEILSMVHNIITSSWQSLKFKRIYSW